MLAKHKNNNNKLFKDKELIRFMPGIHDVIKGAQYRQYQIGVISNNIANSATSGYKKDRLVFNSVMKAKTFTDFKPGNLSRTGNSFDIALANNGFYQVQTPNGIRYTRNGVFMLDSEKNLVNSNGDKVLGEGGPVNIDGNEMNVTDKGEVYVDGEYVDKLAVVDIPDPKFLKKEGDSLFVYDNQAKEAQGVSASQQIEVRQGYREESNVNPIEEMTKLIEASRLYESYLRAVQTYSDINTKLVNDVGRP
ncbi:MAG: flagellar hook-basal body protein [Pseudomonadota bacterium]